MNKYQLITSCAFSLLLLASVEGGAPVSGQPLMPPDSKPLAHIWSEGESGSRFPAGTADVFGNGPYDLFVSLDTVYPFVEFNEDGAPVYGEPESISNGSENGRIVLGSDDVLGLFWSGRTVSIRELDTDFLGWGNPVSRLLTLPGNIHRAAAYRRPDGKLLVALSVADGEGYLTHTPPDANEQDYRPYDGQGRWRGGTPGYKLYTALFGTVNLGLPLMNGPAYSNEKVFLYDNPSLSFIESPSGSNESWLVGTDKGGVVRLFPISEDGSISTSREYVGGPNSAALIHKTILPNAYGLPALNGEWSDLLVGDTGTLWYYKSDGDIAGEYRPKYQPAIAALGTNREHRLGDLPVISTGDINGDDLMDIVAGNDGGRLFWMENVGTASVPEFATPEYLPVDGKELVMRPGPVKSLQGPTESAWGYTCPTLYDWNKDGSLDVILSSSLGLCHVLFQTNQNPPMYSAPQAIYCDGQPLAITWRQQVAVTDWGIEGNDQIVTSDERDFFTVYRRLDDTNVEKGGYLRLISGEPITANARFSGQYGRTKLQVVDWDEDGRLDLLAGVRRWHSIPDPDAGLPQSVGGDRQSGALFLRNLGSNSNPMFQFPEQFHFNGDLIELGVHSTSVSAVNLDGTDTDLLIAEETGSIIYYSREDLTP